MTTSEKIKVALEEAINGVMEWGLMALAVVGLVTIFTVMFSTSVLAGSLVTLIIVSNIVIDINNKLKDEVTIEKEVIKVDDPTEAIQDTIDYFKEESMVSTKDISDGYHTFGELYDHRAKLFSVICNSNKDKAWKSKLHDDGTMFGKPGEMFIVGINTSKGQYTYHYHIDEYWDLFDVEELERAPEFDGHQPSDIDRLFELVD